ncbi:unnamed protein product [Acanthoscelides obtectus]|uniref:Uncharacterized protein n=1 Tax=Acanthoscelides obtectus TaxID=200917 RepID=A0A9P0L086_ACAOB|nr:unnamed protein product [Acanthoscelides obtectus]CAK1619883.1 hypothetical protein AOBTE_LOCUS55 [Acanthoscelides obtectus]
MSDEEKTAGLRTHSHDEEDDYSAMFETAMESVQSKILDEFADARSHFVSQMTFNSEENSNSEVADSESAYKDIAETVDSDSGLPSVSYKFSHKLEETQDVTKDESDDVKLSQNEDNLKHSELEETSDIEAQLLDEKDSERSGNNLNDSKVSYSNKEDLGISSNVSDTSSNDIKAISKLDDSESRHLVIDIRARKEDTTSASSESKTDKASILNEKDSEISDNSLNDSESRRTNYSNTEDLGISSNISDATSSNDTKAISKLDDSESRNSATEASDIRGRQEDITNVSSESKTDNSNSHLVDATNESVTSKNNDEDSAADSSVVMIESSPSDVIVISDSVSSEYSKEQSEVFETSAIEEPVAEKKTEEKYPVNLNPFGDEDEENEEMALHSSQPKSVKPTPARRLKKILASEEDKQVVTPGKVLPKRISLNPFEDDDDTEEQKEPPQPVRRKRISVPKTSFNLFESDDEDENPSFE